MTLLRTATVLLLFATVAACTYDPAFDPLCNEEGATENGRTCINGVWIAADAGPNLDATMVGGDTTVSDEDAGDDPDMGGEDMPCYPESNVDFCARLGFDCGEVTAVDNCGGQRTIMCGMCEEPETCGAVDPNVCGCVPEDEVQFCTRLVKTCDDVTADDNCGVERTQNCGDCTDPAVCGGGGTDNVCACPDQTDDDFCDQAGALCGAFTGVDECGQMRTTDCGSCASPQECGAVMTNQCDCPDDLTVCASLDVECGMFDVSAQCGGSRVVDCGGCQADASCMSNNCVCNPGFVPDGLGNCEDVNECNDGTANCDQNAACMNIPGGFDCTCRSGFTGDGTTCSDVDECADNSDNCDQNAVCMNEVGSFSCMCNSGFRGDGVTCTDIDECSDGTDDCDQNAICTNTPGSFDCTCNMGYTGSGKTCTDIDECADMTDNCDENASCMNTPGSFDCMCDPGFMGDGVTCTPESPIVSVQTVTAVMGNNSSGETVDLPATIDPDNAVAFVSARSNHGELRYSTVDVQLNADTVDVSRANNNQTTVVAVAVVEFDPTKVSVQTGSFSGQGDNSITAVDTTASFYTFTGAIDHNNDHADDRMLSGNLNAAGDSLQIGRESTSGSLSGHYWIAEALDGEFSVQHVMGGISASDSSEPLTINSVDTTSSFVLYSYRTTETNSALDDGIVSCELTNATTVTCERTGSEQEITNLHVQVIEVPGANVQRGSTSFSGGGDFDTGSISAVDQAKSVANLGQTGSSGLCRTDETSTDAVSTAAFTIVWGGNDTVNLRRAQAGNGDATCTWEVIEWP